ncbi:MAG: hypothetical protein ACI4DP_04855 [Candidatus Ornithomonoglobus sp.]
MKKLPFAGFEIEGASTSSKNQIGNFANLISGPFLYRYVIVNNSEANGENDTYRRGIKLSSYMQESFGYSNTFFLDCLQLDESLKDFKPIANSLYLSECSEEERKTCGGETKSVPLYNLLTKYLIKTGLIIRQNYQPEELKIKYELLRLCGCEGMPPEAAFYLHNLYYNEPQTYEIKKSSSAKNSVYIPKLDIMLGFDAPEGFKEWMLRLADILRNDCVHYPIMYSLKYKREKLFIPLISIEIETSKNKHMNGGICNMSKYSYCGILVSGEHSEGHIDFLKKHLGIENVTSICREELT